MKHDVKLHFRTGLRRPQHVLQSCTLQLPFIVLFPEIEGVPSQLNLLHFHRSQYKDNCFLEQLMNMATV